jgi:Family of unknown function (DUF6220)
MSALARVHDGSHGDLGNLGLSSAPALRRESSVEEQMRSTYRYLAWAVPVLVVIQAMAIAVAVFGLGAYNSDHSLPKDLPNSDVSFTGDFGFMIHGMFGQTLIPLVAIVLLVVSFFAKVPGGTKWAGLILGDVVLQVALAFISFGAPVLGLLHGLNAFVLLGLGVMAGRAAMAKVAEEEPYAAV